MSTCALCKAKFVGDVIVSCIGCSGLFHANAKGVNCAGICPSEEKAHALKDAPRTVYRCEQCRVNGFGGPMAQFIEEMRKSMEIFKGAVTDIEGCKADVASIKENIESINSDVSMLKQNKANTTTNISDPHVREAWAAEMRERRRREKNIIVFKLEDHNDHQSDYSTVCNLLTDTNFPVTTMRATRLGKFNAQADKPRLLKLQFNHADDAYWAFRQFRKNNKSPARFAYDKTKAEEQYYKDLRAELADRKLKGAKNLIIKTINSLPVIVTEEPRGGETNPKNK